MGSRSIRCATVDDYALYERFWVQLTAIDAPLGEDWWRGTYQDVLFLEDDGRTVGYAYSYVLGAEGHVGHLIVDAHARRRGVGLALMNAIASRLRDHRCTTWSLNVEEENAGAQALYRRCGMTPRYFSQAISIAWGATDLLPTDASIRAVILDAANDEEVETALAVPPGWLRRIRRRPGRTFAVASRDGKPVGVVAYEPVTSSTPLLRAETPAVARALLEVVRGAHQHRRDDVRLHIDDHPALAAAASSIGGRVILRTLLMQGTLV
ncbi:MAG: GNAT family N-acetyltransferase [Polyangiales bacterium]